MNLNWNRQKEEKPLVGEPRYGFTLTYISFLESLLLYGGTHSKSTDIYLYNMQLKKWKAHKVNSFHKPTPRRYHTAYYSDEIQGLIICGGEAQKSRSLNNLQILLMKEEEWEWKKLLTENNYPARQFHTFTPINNGKGFFIFGGISLPYGTFLNDSWVLKNVNSLQKNQTFSVIGPECQQLKTKGQVPPVRCGHSAYSLGESVFIFGGQSENNEERFSLFILNLISNNWSKHVFNINLLQLVNFSLIPSPQNPAEVLILGGTFVNKKKNNRSIYSILLSNKTIKKLQDSKQQLNQEVLDNCFTVPSGGIGCSWVENKNESRLQIYNFSLAEQEEPESIEPYLKCIKSEQIISQELIKKINNLELLYTQIQGYISTLYRQYRQNYEEDTEIEEEKQKQIQLCLQLKHDYRQIEMLYKQNLQETKQARKQLVNFNENFQECMETEFDEEG